VSRDLSKTNFLSREETNENNEVEDDNNAFAFFTSQLRIPKIIHMTIPIEYPATSLEGVATVYNVTGWKDYKDAFLNASYFVFLLINSHCKIFGFIVKI
jgi:hypothetical protein